MLIARSVLKHSRTVAFRAFSTTASNAGGDFNAKHAFATLGAAALLGAAAAGTMTALDAAADDDEDHAGKYQKRPKQKYASPEPNPIHGQETHNDEYNNPPPRPDLPTIPLDEIAEHCDESSLWYTFRGGVYDLTFFYHGHPGGEPVSNK